MSNNLFFARSDNGSILFTKASALSISLTDTFFVLLMWFIY